MKKKEILSVIGLFVIVIGLIVLTIKCGKALGVPEFKGGM